MNIQLILKDKEVQAIINILGELPTKTGAFPLMVEIQKQANEFVEEQNKNADN